MKRMVPVGDCNRIQLEVLDLITEGESMRKAGTYFRNDIVRGWGDPSRS